MNVLKMVMFETGGAIDAPSRPYELDMREGASPVLEDLDELTLGGTNITSHALARLSSGILVPSTVARPTRIDGGWEEKRIMFAMVVEVQGSSDGIYSDIRYITGYTDRSDFSSNLRGEVHFPEDMRLYFNSVTRISLNQIPGHNGRVIRPTIRDNNLVLRKDSMMMDRSMDRSPFGSKPSLIRPTDVLKRAGSNNYLNGMTRGLSNSIGKNTIGKFNLDIQLSKRKNNNSAEHMATTVKSYMYARAHGEDDGGKTGFMTIGEQDRDPDYLTAAAAGSTAAEDTLSQDSLFDEMRRFSEVMTTGYIEWGEFKRMAPDFNENRDLPFTPWQTRIKSANRGRSSGDNHNRGIADYQNSSSFYDNTPEALASLMIAQATPEILANGMYSSVKGLVLNSHPQRGEPDVHMSMAMPFMDGIPVKYGFNYLRSQYANVVLPNVSKNGLMHIEAMVNAHIDNDIEIWISIDGGPEEYFCYPVWGESIIAPVITDDERDLEGISKGVSSLMEDFALRVEKKNQRNVEIATNSELFNRERKATSFEAGPGRPRSEDNSRDRRRSSGSKIEINL